MALHKLVFDTTDATTQAASSNVGAYVRSSDGTLITHTQVGADEGLDVYLLNTSLTVTATDFDIRDLSAASDSVSISDGTDTLEINADGSINVNATISATDLDIRDLTHVSDSIRLGDGTTLFTGTTVGADTGLDVNLINANIEVTQGTSPWVVGDGGGSLTVDAVDLDIRDLTAASDSVQAWAYDGAGTAITSTLEGAKQALDVYVANSIDVDDGLANTAIATAANALDVANTAEDLVASPLANRKYLYAYNNGNKAAYIGASGVSAANGFPIFPGGLLEMRAGPSIVIEWVADDTNQEMRTLELS